MNVFQRPIGEKVVGGRGERENFLGKGEKGKFWEMSLRRKPSPKI